MADHVAEQIADAVVSAVTGLTTTGARVYRTRDTEERPLQENEVPGLNVMMGGESPLISSMGIGRLLERVRLIHIDAHVKAASGYDSTLTLILKELEIAIAGASLGGAKYGHIEEVGEIEVSEGADKPIAKQRFTFAFTYFTAFNAPDVAL